MSPPLPYAVRAFALSHARAWSTAAWTGIATALAAGLDLSPGEWLALASLTVVCGATIRMISVQLVAAWVALHPDLPPQLSDPARASSEYDRITRRAFRAIT